MKVFLLLYCAASWALAQEAPLDEAPLPPPVDRLEEAALIENATPSISVGSGIFGYRLQTQRELYIRPCFVNIWGQFRKVSNRNLSISNYYPGLCTHLLLELEWLQEEITGMTHRTLGLAPTNSQCNKLQELTATMSNSDVTNWAKTHCEFIQLYVPSATCNDVMSFIKNCQVEKQPASDATVMEKFVDKVKALKESDPKLKLLLVVSARTFGPFLFEELVNSTRRTAFLYATVDYVRHVGLDGAVLDWDHPSSLRESHADFLREMRLLFNDVSSREVAIPLSVGVIMPANKPQLQDEYDIQTIAGVVDFAALMPVNISQLWNEKLDIWKMKTAVEYCAEQGMPRSKIVLGATTFGIGWKITSSGDVDGPISANADAEIPSFLEICNLMKTTPALRELETDFKLPYLIVKGRKLFFQDEYSLIELISYVRLQNLGGVMVVQPQLDDMMGQCFARNGQRFPLTSIVARELGNVRT